MWHSSGGFLAALKDDDSDEDDSIANKDDSDEEDSIDSDSDDIVEWTGKKKTLPPTIRRRSFTHGR
jgi:hypothetical protein